MLFGRVTDFNTDYQLRHTIPVKTDVPSSDPTFIELDHLNGEGFLSSLPEYYGTYLQKLRMAGLQAETFDTDLYLVHLIPHGYVLIIGQEYLI